MLRNYFKRLLLVGILLIAIPRVVFAESSYVLPYPSAMPGSMFYKIDLIKDFMLRYWYFGDLGQFDYNRKEADKYLVQAKILFEYNQYLLASQALLKSDEYFIKIKPNLVSAKLHGKKINEKLTILKQEAEKHIEELQKIKQEVPSTFTWNPEKTASTHLLLWDEIDESVKLRTQNYE